MKKIIVVSLWTLLVLGIIASALGFTAIYNGWIGYMPPIEELQNPINRFATQVFLLMVRLWAHGTIIVKTALWLTIRNCLPRW